MSAIFVGKMFRILTCVYLCMPITLYLKFKFPRKPLIQPTGHIPLMWKAKLSWDWEDKLGKRMGNAAGKSLASCVTAVLSSSLGAEAKSGRTPAS